MRSNISRSWVLPLTAAAQFMLTLDFSIINVALAQIQYELGFAPTNLQWVAVAYALTFGALLVVGGRLGDRFGYRRTFIAGLIVFGLASLAGGLASSALVLIVARFVQGMGAALVAPAALAILNSAYVGSPGHTRAMSWFQASAAIGASTGIVLGGLLTGTVGWRWVLLINPPLALALIALAFWRIGKGTVRQGVHLSFLRSLIVTVALGALVFGVTQAEDHSFTSPATWIPLGCAAVGLTAFILLDRRATSPTIPRAVLTEGRWGVLVGTMAVGAILGAYVYFLALFLQNDLDLSAISTGLALLPATAISFIASGVITPRLLPRLGASRQLLLALLLLALGQFWLSGLTPQSDYVTGVLVGIVLSGCGVGLAYPAAAMAITTPTAATQRGVAGALFTTSQQLGSAIGLAALATVAAATAPAGASSSNYGAAFLSATAIALIAAGVVAVTMRRPHAAPQQD